MVKKKGNDNKRRKVDSAWEKLFDELTIIKEIKKKGFFVIDAKSIKKYYEPRLMTKFDYKDSLPSIFIENQLTILPITRGSYIIGKFKVYEDFETVATTIEKVNFPSWIEGIDYKNIYSEANAINCAFIAKIFNNILNEAEPIYPVFNGRMSSGEFKFNILDINEKKVNIEVSKAQCEIDAAFESKEKILLIEAKNNVFNDFIVRQLYYPYRLIKEKVKKEVIPCFLTYYNDIFSFYIYEFEDEYDYNSLKLKDVKKFMIDDIVLDFNDILEVLKIECIEEDKKIPFPQADKFENIMCIAQKLYSEQDILSKEDISLEIGFVSRQADYYSNACAYLGFADRMKGSIKLSKEGRYIFSKRSREKYIEIFKLILRHKVFNRVMSEYLENLEAPSISDIVIMMKEENIQFASESLYKRRAQTVKSWVEWIIEIVNLNRDV